MRAADREPLRYLLGGALSALVNNLILILGDHAGLGYASLMILTWAIGGSVAYLWHVRFTFQAVATLASYLRFLAGVALGVPGGFAIVALFKSGLGTPMWVAAVGSTAVLFLYNYLSARLAILWRAGN